MDAFAAGRRTEDARVLTVFCNAQGCRCLTSNLSCMVDCKHRGCFHILITGQSGRQVDGQSRQGDAHGNTASVVVLHTEGARPAWTGGRWRFGKWM